MAVVKGQYDPVKAVEGMFNGSVTRIAYVLKDPTNYGGSTKTVLAECAKRFQDALDDCEIQLLEAKWYLEHQLKMNQLRREAQAREMGTAAKRKHDEIKEASDITTSEESATKKPKTDQSDEKPKAEEPAKPKNPVIFNKPPPNDSPNAPKPADTKQATEKKDEQKNDVQTTLSVSKSNEPPKPTPKEALPPVVTTSIPDDFAKPTPQAASIGTNDDYNFESNFESMFVEPAGGDTADVNKLEGDLDFDYNSNPFAGGAGNDSGQDSTSLDMLLPGLETYAKLDDNPPGENDGVIKNNENNPQDATMPTTYSNDFNLPEMGGELDELDFLNDDTMNAGGDFDFFDDF